MFSCPHWLPGLGALVEKRTESVPRRGVGLRERLVDCLFLACAGPPARDSVPGVAVLTAWVSLEV